MKTIFLFGVCIETTIRMNSFIACLKGVGIWNVGQHHARHVVVCDNPGPLCRPKMSQSSLLL